MKLPLRIAILECDTPLNKTKAQFGGYGGVFRQLMERAADTLGHPGLDAKHGLELSYWHVEKEVGFPNMEDIDAIMMTGSRYNSFEDIPWIVSLVEFVKTVLAQERVRIIGVCFGHQIVGRALGLPVGRSDAGWEVSVVTVELTDVGKQILKLEGLNLFQMHQDIVKGFPEDAEKIGCTKKCANQGMYKKGKYITVQGHPEFTHDIVEEILHSREEKGIYPPGVFKDGMRRLQDHDDGVIVAQGFLRFLLEE